MKRPTEAKWFWHLVVGYVLLVAAGIVPGVFYWYATGASWARCVYGDVYCSLTVATYLLCALGLATLVAAAFAAAYAKRAFDMEREVVVGINACSKKSHEHECEELHLRVTGKRKPRFVAGPPRRGDYTSRDFDCYSAGRSPLINGRLILSGYDPGLLRPKRDLEVPLGNIPPDHHAHIRLWLPVEVAEWNFVWQKTATHRGPVLVEVSAQPRAFKRPTPSTEQPEAVLQESANLIASGQLEIPEGM